MRNAGDSEEGRIQFYTMRSQTRLEALKSAVNSFIDAAAATNTGIDDSTQQHQLSIVLYQGIDSTVACHVHVR